MKNTQAVKLFSILIAVCFVLLCAHDALCTTYYVSPSGSNSNPGTSSAPFQTINNAARIVNPGDTVMVMDGIYYENADGTVGLNIARGGTSESPVVFQAQNPGKAVIDGGNARLHGIQILTVSHVRVQGFEIRNFRNMGVVVNGTYHRIEYNIIHNNGAVVPGGGGGQNGIYVHSLNTSNITIHGNTIYQNGRMSFDSTNVDGNKDHGVYLCSPNSTISYNLIYRNQAYGIQICGEVPLGTTRIINNTITFEQNRGGIVLWQSGAQGVLIDNNIIASNHGYGIEFAGDGGGHTFRNNDLYNNSSGSIQSGSQYSSFGNLNSDPLFVSSSTNDFRLKAGSPALNTGLISDYQGIRSVTSYDGIPITDASGTLLVSSINMGAAGDTSGGTTGTPPGGTAPPSGDSSAGSSGQTGSDAFTTVDAPASGANTSYAGGTGSGSAEKSGGGGCFIATAAYGSYVHPHVKTLRIFRDTLLMTSSLGRSCVQWYYRVSPPIAEVIGRHSALSGPVRVMLLPAIGLAWLCLSVGVVPTILMVLLVGTGIFMATRMVRRSL